MLVKANGHRLTKGDARLTGRHKIKSHVFLALISLGSDQLQYLPWILYFDIEFRVDVYNN